MKKIKLITILLIIVTTLLMLTTISNAALQANGGIATTQTVDNWMINVRKMESLGGTLGLTETINSNLTSSSGSNNLDIHMEKNTEYGAIAILSASSYGNPNVITDGGTTTGNETGIIINLNKEWVAAGTNRSTATIFQNAESRYKDVYIDTDSYINKKGDAIEETKGWHNSSYTDLFGSYAVYNSLILRAIRGGIFSYDAYGRDDRYDSYYTKAWASRAIMICGEGI